MELIFKKTLLEKITHALKEARHQGREVEAIGLAQEDVPTLYKELFSGLPMFLRASPSYPEFLRQVKKGTVQVMGLQVRLATGETPA